MDALVAAGLIVGTLLGAVLLSAFFAINIGATQLLSLPTRRRLANVH